MPRSQIRDEDVQALAEIAHQRGMTVADTLHDLLLSTQDVNAPNFIHPDSPVHPDRTVEVNDAFYWAVGKRVVAMMAVAFVVGALLGAVAL